jgi:tripartite-type tricarboxylate transporter receptor subunit TctC
MPTRRALLAAAGAVVTYPARAQDYPARPVRIIVPYPPGGATDVLARLLASRIGEELKQTFIIDNRGGGASQVGTQAIATAAPDGYTIGLIDSAFTINPGLFAGKLPYDTLKDFAAVSLIATAPLVLVVHPSLGVNTAQELVALAKQKAGSLAFAIPGLGTPVHLAFEQLRQVAGIDLVGVPYRGAGPSIADFIAGQVQATFATVPSILEHVRGGRARALGIVGERSPLLPRCAEHGGRGPSRNRCGAHVRTCHTRGDACRHRQSPQRGGRRLRAYRAAAWTIGRARLRADRFHSGRVPHPHRGRYRQMVAHHRRR